MTEEEKKENKRIAQRKYMAKKKLKREIDKSEVLTIHKDNNLIKFEPIKTLSLEALRLINYLYHYTQKHLTHLKKNKIVYLEKDMTVPVKQQTLRKWLKIETKNDYVEVIRKTLKELSDGIELTNYLDSDGVNMNLWGIEQFIKKPRHRIEGKNKVFYLTLDAFMFNKIINMKNGWTEIDLQYQKNFRSGNTFRLYEYLKSIENLPKQNVKFYIEDFNKLFNTNHKYLSKSLRIVKNSLNQINETDIKVKIIEEQDGQGKYIKFNFTKHSEKIAPTQTAKTKSEELLISKLLIKNMD